MRRPQKLPGPFQRLKIPQECVVSEAESSQQGIGTDGLTLDFRAHKFVRNTFMSLVRFPGYNSCVTSSRPNRLRFIVNILS